MGTGRHRTPSVAMGVAAVSLVASITGVAATQPESISTPLVDLTALIAVGSSTNPSGAGVENFFGGRFKDETYTGPTGTDIAEVNFLTGPWGIDQALQANRTDPRNAIVASGWGAANASLLLSELAAANDPVVKSTLWVLDNNVAAPDGGFGTRYPWFALIGVNPFPTPTDTGATVVVTAYQYNYNSNAPADLLNPVAHLNSLVAYLYGYQEQQSIELPVDDMGNPTCGSNSCTVMDGDRVVAYVVQKDKTTYVTYTTDQLPLARLIRDVVPIFGDMIADRVEPLLKVLVDSAYYGGNPIPADPSQYRPARLFPSPTEIASTISKIPAAIQQGFSPNSSQEDPTSSTLTESHQRSAARVKTKSDETAAPLTNVMRTSEKAEPGKTGDDQLISTGPELQGKQPGTQTNDPGAAPLQVDAADSNAEPGATGTESGDGSANDLGTGASSESGNGSATGTRTGTGSGSGNGGSTGTGSGSGSGS